MENLFAIDLRECDFEDSDSSSGIMGSCIEQTILKRRRGQGNMNMIHSYDDTNIHILHAMCKEYIRGFIKDDELYNNIIELLYSYTIKKTKDDIATLRSINDYFVFDKITKDVVYTHSKYGTYVDEEYFRKNGCRILDTKGSFNFMEYDKVCIEPKGNVLWGIFSTGSNRFTFNKEIIPCVHTRKGKIKMVLNGL